VGTQNFKSSAIVELSSKFFFKVTVKVQLVSQGQKSTNTDPLKSVNNFQLAGLIYWADRIKSALIAEGINHRQNDQI